MLPSLIVVIRHALINEILPACHTHKHAKILIPKKKKKGKRGSEGALDPPSFLFRIMHDRCPFCFCV